MLELQEGTSKLQGTCYFEFVKNSEKKKNCWNENAYYLEDETFLIFSPVFHKASERFDWYDFNKLNQTELKNLTKELSFFESNLKQIRNEEEFKKFFEAILYWIEEDKPQKHWSDYVEIFRNNSLKLHKLADECLDEKQVLWVLGI